MSRPRIKRKILYEMSLISSIKNKYLRRILMVLAAPVLFVINIIITFTITFLMWMFMLITTTIRNSSVLLKSLKEKW